jgi:uroporphyrinogen decarboxylase
MTPRERIKTILSGQPADRCGFWLGNPSAAMWPILHDFFGTKTEEELRLLLKDDFRWIRPDKAYKHPEGHPMFDMKRRGNTLSAEGAFADCESPEEVENYEWPDPDYLDFSEFIQDLDQTGDFYRAASFWSPFFHMACDFFGMENYFVKMYTHPEVVHAVTRRTVDFLVEANRRLFNAVGDRSDAMFFGNDFGSQQDLLVSPAAFREFIFPYFKQLTDVGHVCGKQVILHSCGSIYKVIPDLIRLGVDGLHPLQAKAGNMDADTLAREFKGQVAFVGAVDTQELLIRANPDQVAEEVRRLKRTLGPALIVSPSHEALLPGMKPENIEAMARAAVEM